MKRILKMLSLLLAVLLIIPLADCKKDKETGDSSGFEESSREDEPEKTNVLFEDGKFAYKIVIPEKANSNELFAGAELKNFIFKSCGREMELLKENEITDTEAGYFYIGATKKAAKHRLAPSAEKLGASGYILKSIGKDVYVVGTTSKATVYAVYDLLKELVGYEPYAYDELYVDKADTIKFAKFNTELKPYVEYRNAPGGEVYYDNISAARMRFCKEYDAFCPDYGISHTTLNFLKPAEFLAAHPDWYNNSSVPKCLCYTAHGNARELKQMREAVLEKMKQVVINAAKAGDIPKYISFTQQDNLSNLCGCSACKNLKEKYGTESAAIIRFLNPVAKDLNKWMDENYPGKHVNIVFFAYVSTAEAPVKKNSEGVYEPVDKTVKANPYLTVWYAPIFADEWHSFRAPENSQYYNTLKKWSAVCDDVVLWLYNSSHYDYFAISDTFGAMQDTYRIIEECNAGYVFDELRYSTVYCSAFEEFKVYLCSKFLYDINLDYTELRDDFFSHYFDQAAEAMKKIYEETRLWCAYQRENTDGPISIVINTKFWPQSTVEYFLKLFPAAYAAIEDVKVINPLRYQVLYDRISKEELAYTHLILELYSETLPDDELKKMRKAWKDEVLRIGFPQAAEGVPIPYFWRNW